jgi:hypothetical protein
MLQFYPERVLGVEPTGYLDEREREILIDAPVAILVGIGQCAAGDPAANAQVVELARMRPQTSLDVAQAFPVSELREAHAQILIEMRKRERGICPSVFRYASPECVKRQIFHQLSEHQLSRMHRTTSRKIRKFPTH